MLSWFVVLFGAGFFNLPGWWLQPRSKILVHGKDYPIYYGKIKNVPNHHPDIYYCILYIFSSAISQVQRG
jgi:hypothetical protein